MSAPKHRVEVVWSCPPCQVAGQDPAGPGGLRCWSCGGPVVVAGRVTVRVPA